MVHGGPWVVHGGPFCFCWDACFVFGQYDVCEGNAISRTFCLFLLLSISSNIIIWFQYMFYFLPYLRK